MSALPTAQAVSPSIKNRGTLSLPATGLNERMLPSPTPLCLLPVITGKNVRQRVMSSGKVTRKTALPSRSVRSRGSQKALSEKLLRMELAGSKTASSFPALVVMSTTPPAASGPNTARALESVMISTERILDTSISPTNSPETRTPSTKYVDAILAGSPLEPAKRSVSVMRNSFADKG